MGEAKRKKAAALGEVEAMASIDRDLLAQAVRQTVTALTDFHGADCLLYAVVGAGALRQMGVDAKPVAGSAAWRVGPGDSDVISHATEVNAPMYVPDAAQKAALFHAWIEAPGYWIDFSTWTLRDKARQLDEADGGRTAVHWCPDYLWVSKTDGGGSKTPMEVVNAMSEGAFVYLRKPDVEQVVGPSFAEIDRTEGLVFAAMMSYKALLSGNKINIIGVSPDGEPQTSSEDLQDPGGPRKLRPM